MTNPVLQALSEIVRSLEEKQIEALALECAAPEAPPPLPVIAYFQEASPTNTALVLDTSPNAQARDLPTNTASVLIHSGTGASPPVGRHPISAHQSHR